MDGSAFGGRGFGRALTGMVVLAFVGLAALLVGVPVGLWLLCSHVTLGWR